MKIWTKVLFSVLVLLLLFYIIPWKQVWDAGTQLSLFNWTFVLFGFIAGHLIGVYKWRMMVNAGVNRLRYIDALRCYAAGLFANLCLPTIVGGDVLRAAMAGKITRRPEGAIIGGTADRISDFTATGILIGIGGVLAGDVFPAWTTALGGMILLVLFILAVTGLPFLLRRPLVSWPARHRRKIARIMITLRRFYRHPQIALRALVLSLIIQSTFVLLNIRIGESVGIQIPFTAWFFVWPIAKVAALVPISMGGLGVREAAQAALLLPFGVPAPKGLAVALIWQTVLIAGGLCGGLTWFVMNRFARNASSAEQPQRNDFKEVSQ